MSQPPTEPPKKKRPRISWFGWTVILLIAAVILGRLAWGWIMDARLAWRVSALHKAGEPTTFADFPLPAVPEDQNAWPLYERAFSLVEKLPKEVLYGREIKDKQSGLTRWVDPESLDDNSLTVVRLLREAAARPGCAPLVDRRPGRPFKELMRRPINAQTLESARLMRLSGRINLAAGKPDAALADLCAGIKVGRALVEYPTILTMLVKGNHISIVRNSMAELIDESNPSEAALRSASQSLKDTWPPGQLIQYMRGDRCLGLAVGRALQEDPNLNLYGGDSQPLQWVEWRGKALRPLIVADAVAYLDKMEYWVAATKKPWPDVARDMARVAADPAPFKSAPWYRPLTGIDDLPLYRSVRNFHETSAVVNLGRLAIALRLCKMKQGEYPETLDVLAPEFIDKLPVDPFSEKPYKYRKAAWGFEVYSVGRNGQDDGGVETPGGSEDGDIVWKCTR